MGKRVLITGLASFWGGRLAQTLERDTTVEVILGLDTKAPTLPLERTEFVQTDQSYGTLARIVLATQIDTILHTFLIVDSTRASDRTLHETNVIGTMNLLAAAGMPDSPVRQVVVKSSGLVYGASWQDPAWFREDMTRVAPAKSRVERSLLEVEDYLNDFAEDNPHVIVSLLRFANVLGTDIVTPITKVLQLPLAPSILGFDPMVQFIEEDDVVRAIEFVMRNDIPGVFNVAGDGRIPWSEVASICGKRLAPMPPIFTELATVPLARLGFELPPELLALLRYGRGLDNRSLKQHGFEYRYTTAGAVQSFAEACRLQRSIGHGRVPYQYDRELETFFRHSRAVVRDIREPSHK